ncbi:hypothetical protein CS063_09665 [Sporanaerobium hydrogeniformans]|uniref:Uncharacterized protein n=1 Tax=Sporanaerobium hydrogeniformans TaxID=3072179 RepID=A0AC61DBF1_9FIRM|nr:HPr family phosphocarrier protein [Sporanaerobium hydrogeniformans]PHV70561.1 hypothetical protein CS063_09665 [Sporanaerobium hydrogeniformans]
MVSEKVIVLNPTGLHARPAAQLIKTAAQFKSHIIISKDNQQGSAKSLIALLGLGIRQGTEITVMAEGPDEEDALSSLIELIRSGFGELKSY